MWGLGGAMVIKQHQMNKHVRENTLSSHSAYKEQTKSIYEPSHEKTKDKVSEKV